MFYLIALAMIGASASFAGRLGPREGLWAAWFSGILLTPAWMLVRFGSLTIDLRCIGAATGLTLLGLGALSGKVVSPPGSRNRVLLADLVVVGMFLGLVNSQLLIGRVGPLTAPDIARRWILPYLVGRVFVGSVGDFDRLIPIVSKFLLGLSAYSIVEAVIKVNPVNKVLGKTYDVLEAGEGYRWGLKRAQGPLDHPIFYGMMLVLLLPWAIAPFRKAMRGEGPRWWLAVMPALSAAVLVTVSRGAQIATAITFGVTFFFARPRWRPLVLVMVVVGGVTAVSAKEQIGHILSKWGGEKEEDVRLLMIDGEEVEYTGTNHRILLFKVYRIPIERAGAFGYGSELRGVEIEESVAQRFGSIDNHYLLHYLQYGKVGLGAFLLLTATSLASLAIVAWDSRTQVSLIAGPLFGAMLAVAVSLLSVWFSADFGAVYMFCAGLAANLRCLPAETPGSPSEGPAGPSVEMEAGPEARRADDRRLAAGHAPVRRPALPGGG